MSDRTVRSLIKSFGHSLFCTSRLLLACSHWPKEKNFRSLIDMMPYVPTRKIGTAHRLVNEAIMCVHHLPSCEVCQISEWWFWVTLISLTENFFRSANGCRRGAVVKCKTMSDRTKLSMSDRMIF